MAHKLQSFLNCCNLFRNLISGPLNKKDSNPDVSPAVLTRMGQFVAMMFAHERKMKEKGVKSPFELFLDS